MTSWQVDTWKVVNEVTLSEEVREVELKRETRIYRKIDAPKSICHWNTSTTIEHLEYVNLRWQYVLQVSVDGLIMSAGGVNTL